MPPILGKDGLYLGAGERQLVVLETAFRFDDLDDARRLLGFFFGDRGVAGAALEVPFRVGIFTRLSLGA